MNGNVSEAGVRLDFEWMKRIGIAGVQNFDAAFKWGATFDTPQLVEKPLIYMTPEWQKTLRYSVSLAKDLGLEFTIPSTAGWSMTGGPWVQPRQAMKKLVWSETFVKGGVPFQGRLALPPETTGPFQNIPSASFGAGKTHGADAPVYYADVAVVAYRMPKSEARSADLNPQVTSSSGDIEAALLSDGDLAKALALPFEKSRDAWIQLTFPKPQRIQAVTLAAGAPWAARSPLDLGNSGTLEASQDGRTFRKIADLPRNDTLEQTVAFAPVTARIFRAVFKPPVPTRYQILGIAPPTSAYEVAELVLHPGVRINRFEDKAGFSTRQIKDEDDTPAVSPADAIDRDRIIDLTSRMRADGSLNWTPASGRWVVLRFGYSLTGMTNHPASRAGTGLEIDKLNADYVKSYIETYLAQYEEAVGSNLMGHDGIQYLVTDSYEAGPQNWTDDMLQQFQRRRGYSALSWLPVLAGRVVESAADSDRFLWDFRKTIGELIAEAHYGQITASLHHRGLRRYGEAHEASRVFVGDGMQAKKTADIPMAAAWASRLPGITQETYDADIRESASVAHIYGQNIVAAESFTAFGNTYGFTPESLKPVADRAMAMGLNRFVIHTSVHQPDTAWGPGLGLGPFGQWFTRKEVWAEQAGGWISYLTRSSYLLQQGRFIADVAYLYGEDANITALFGKSAPAVPQGYNFDFINSDALLNEVEVRHHKLVTRSGMEYRVLALDQSTRRMSVAVLRKIRDLVRAGAAVVGPKPTQTPTLMDDEAEFHAIVTELWGDTLGERTVGAGTVFAGQSIDEALRAMQISADVELHAGADAGLRFVHRSLGEEGDVYFMSCGNMHPETEEMSFRVSGRKPELWRADTGKITPLSYRMEHGRTIVPLRMEAQGAMFVVFRQATSEPSAVISEPVSDVLATLAGPWDLRFPPGLGAPARARFDRLGSWTDSAESGIKYFSGTATYSKKVRIPPDWLTGRSRVQIDLGEVKSLAEVLVNGRSFGVLWKAPFVVDITDAVKVGANEVDIKVTNLWPNRLIGDKQPGAHPVAFAAFDPFEANSPLRQSGLLGPVTLIGVHDQSSSGASVSGKH